MTRARPERRAVAVALALVAVAGFGLASAAQLDLRPASLGAGTAAVSSCQPPGQPVDVSFTNGFASGAYTITGVTVANVHADCVDETLRLRLVASNGTPVGSELTWTVTASGTRSWTVTPVAAASVARAAVVIHS